ncbi:hypothetical protein BFJ66_g1004 [Fusarium oxysporum f. sp. cepae]|uniref:JmjC domain-containing protein n=1 Tax=Fusarium oxysporum f. sp. cepae TaxID=396571 RepID=A0A3L6NII3_FUSOX|nr:hypothetical protein BFJ65_g8374 [Fusarium oxysporum f. sp. cepae]RKK34476.1 hypothetical protein BFJ67_g13754 [Fusarium oxysporum f. sp. cepae]RKK62197.1 hypothetical protein BFJ66_g1004 [Fusarium oxysporum f. sp. cepae]
MSADYSLFHSRFEELVTEVSHIRADVNAHISSQSRTRSKSQKDRSGDSRQRQPWNQIQRRLDRVDRVIHKLESMLPNIADTSSSSPLSSERQPDNQTSQQDVRMENAQVVPDQTLDEQMNVQPEEAIRLSAASQENATELTPLSANSASEKQTESQGRSAAKDSSDGNIQPAQPSSIPGPDQDYGHIRDFESQGASRTPTPGAGFSGRSSPIAPEVTNCSRGSTGSISTPSPLPPTDASSPILSVEDMGEGLVSKLADLDRCHAPQRMTVPVLDVNLAEMKNHIRMDDEGWQYTSIKYQAGPKGKGYTMVYISTDEPKPELDWSAFTATTRRPTVAESKEIFENTVKNPPAGDIPYFNGHAEFPSVKPLDPGKRIKNIPTLKDLHSQYNHISTGPSANRIHCENMTYRVGSTHHGFRSFNEVYAGPGYKLWLVIAPYHITKFNDFFTETFKCGTCGQRIGHKSVLIAPSRLDKEEIDYTIEVVGRGEAFRTLPGQQHQIINYGACAARSINYLHEDDVFEPENVTYCCKCGLIQYCEKSGATLVKLPRTSLESPKPAKRHHSHSLHKPATTRACTEAAKRIREGINKTQTVDPLCNIPDFDKSNTAVDILLMAMSIRSKVAIDQLCTLTRELLRQRQSGTGDMTEDVDVDNENIIDKHLRFLQRALSESALANYSVRHAQVCLAREVDRKKGEDGRSRASSTDVHGCAKRLGMRNVDYHLQEGRKWIAVCGHYNGLQPFILLGSKVSGAEVVRCFGVSTKRWNALRGDRLQAFHQLFCDPFSKQLIAAGKLFQDLLDKKFQPILEWENVLNEVGCAPDLVSSLTSYMQLASSQANEDG